ncbi:TPA: helix-turn-helix transcriptional regulator [Serratia fonticola]|nr:helix-turn-helix transcriptional regulator [Serratia fonticola]
MKPKLGDGKSGYHLIDVIVLSSKSIFEKLPTRDRAFDDDGIGAIVFCSVNMEHIIKGLGGYENAIFFTEELSKKEVKEALKSIIFGRDDSRKKMFERIDFDELTDRERLVSMLFKKGKNQRQISNITGINVKTVSSHLRSAMFKYHVNNVSEYRVKLSYIKDII